MGDRFLIDGITIYKQAVKESGVFHIAIQIRVGDISMNSCLDF